MKCCRSIAAALLSFTAVCQPVWSSNVEVVSGDWHPYTSAQETTDAERLLENLLLAQGIEVGWAYPGFDFAAQHLRAGVVDAGFPFFKTEQRAREFVFSDPVFEVRNSVIYRSDNSELVEVLESSSMRTDPSHRLWQSFRFGLVSGYSYRGFFAGEPPEDSVLFTQERDAMMALLDGEIDLLPIETRVWQSLALRHFPNRLYKIAEVQELAWREPVHFMASQTKAGEALVAAFNEQLTSYRKRNPNIQFDMNLSSLAEELGQGTVRLRATQMQPLIKGYSNRDGESESKVLIPQGTSALVLKWSDSYFSLNSSLSTIKILKDRTQVLLVNGPHVGQTVYVENAHLEVK